jgi:hypothetical protein
MHEHDACCLQVSLRARRSGGHPNDDGLQTQEDEQPPDAKQHHPATHTGWQSLEVPRPRGLSGRPRPPEAEQMSLAAQSTLVYPRAEYDGCLTAVCVGGSGELTIIGDPGSGTDTLKQRNLYAARQVVVCRVQVACR